MSKTNKCESCPVTAGRCHGERVKRLCDLQRDRVEYRDYLVRTATDDDLGDEQTPPPKPAWLARLELVHECDYRSDELGECSCTARQRCGLARGTQASTPWAVTLADCLRCVAATEPRPSEP